MDTCHRVTQNIDQNLLCEVKIFTAGLLQAELNNPLKLYKCVRSILFLIGSHKW